MWTGAGSPDLYFYPALSALLWSHTPLNAMQFPWRFLVLFDVAAALGIGLLVVGALRSEAAAGRWVARLLVGGFALTMAVGLAAEHRRWLPTEPITASNAWALEERIGPVEWLAMSDRPIGFRLRDIKQFGGVMPPLDKAPEIATTTPGATVALITSQPMEMIFEASSAEGMEIVARRTFWRHWRLEPLEGGAPVPLAATDGHPLVTARLPGGDGRWRLSLQRPLAVLIGIGVSVLALALSALALVLERRIGRASKAL
ncbi:MAG: hypothetical protein AAF675_03770 [Pseudomonadota bacterium]